MILLIRHLHLREKGSSVNDGLKHDDDGAVEEVVPLMTMMTIMKMIMSMMITSILID